MEPIILPRISDQKPLVSVIAITYNHESYIRDCLEGFLMQKTNFPVEIIIHDDASTDHTADIIREYYEKRPDLFHVIIERENLYSQKKPIVTPLYEKVQGKYIALCECDDYWIDPLKLQKQFDLCEKEDIVGCVGYYIKEENGEKTIKDYSKDIYVLKKNNPGMHYFHTSTYFFRASAIRKVLKEYNTISNYSWQDRILFNCLSSLGDIKIVQEPLSCYRITGHGVATSLSAKQHSYNLVLKQMTLLYLFGPKGMRAFHGKYCVRRLIHFIRDRDTSFSIKWQCIQQLICFMLLWRKFCLLNKM